MAIRRVRPNPFTLRPMEPRKPMMPNKTKTDLPIYNRFNNKPHPEIVYDTVEDKYYNRITDLYLDDEDIIELKKRYYIYR